MIQTPSNSFVATIEDIHMAQSSHDSAMDI